jgi:hypothetical protein
MPFTCPVCQMTSHHPKDEEHGWCAVCHDFTGTDGLAAVRAEDAEIAARLDRVDTALAKRVGDHIRQQAAFRRWLNDWLRCYSTDIFPEPDLKKAAEILKANGMTIDQLSADMGRHVLTRVIARLDSDDDVDTVDQRQG